MMKSERKKMITVGGEPAFLLLSGEQVVVAVHHLDSYNFYMKLHLAHKGHLATTLAKYSTQNFTFMSLCKGDEDN